MPEDDAVAFARFFVTELKAAGIPWSMNELGKYYDVRNKSGGGWFDVITHTARGSGKKTEINVRRILDAIVEEL